MADYKKILERLEKANKEFDELESKGDRRANIVSRRINKIERELEKAEEERPLSEFEKSEKLMLEECGEIPSILGINGMSVDYKNNEIFIDRVDFENDEGFVIRIGTSTTDIDVALAGLKWALRLYRYEYCKGLRGDELHNRLNSETFENIKMFVEVPGLVEFLKKRWLN